MIPTVNNLKEILKNPIFSTNFYAECENYLKDKDGQLYEIPENKYILEPLRLFLIYQDTPLKLYLCKELPSEIENYCYRKLTLSSSAQNCLRKQIAAIKGESFSKLCDTTTLYPVNYFVISNQNINGEELKYCFENISLLLGIKSLEMLEYQNIDRLCSFIKSENKSIQKGLKPFFDFYNIYNKLSIIEKERILIFSGCVLTVLGTIYTDDVDIMYIGSNIFSANNNITKFKDKVKGNKNYDYHIIYKDRVEKHDSTRVRNYLFKWFTKGWPRLGGVASIFDVVVDPEHHFHFMGMRFISIELTVQRTQKRSSAAAYVDLLLLEKMNNYTKTNICFPNLSIREGRISIFNDELISIKIKKLVKLLKSWYNINMSYEELSKKILICRDKPLNKVKPTKYIYTSEILKYNEAVLEVYAPDKDDIMSINIDNYKEIKNSNTSIFLFNFTIQSLINNISFILDDLKNIKKECTVIITCIYKPNLLELIKSKTKYEIISGDEPIYGIYNFPDRTQSPYYHQVMTYFRGYEEYGKIEYIVDIDFLVEQFEKVGFKQIIKKNFMELPDLKLKQMREKFNDSQKKVIELHNIIILKNGHVGGSTDFSHEYEKYKTKYLSIKNRQKN